MSRGHSFSLLRCLNPAHIARVVTAKLRERSKEKTRSSRWPAVRRAFIAEHPSCAACGATVGLQVHHKQPFHLEPALELDPENLITLCEAVGGPECHLRIGHGDDFKAYNPHVVEDAAACLASPDELAAIQGSAKAGRVYVEGGAG